MKVRALIPFNAYGYIKQAGEVFDIEDRGQKLDLEKIGFIEPIETTRTTATRKTKE